MAVVNATQKGTIVGKLKSLKRGEVKTFPSGTEYVDYSARIVLPNGISLFNEKRFFSPNNPSEFTAKGISEMESMIETLEEALVNGEELFVYKRITPTKDKKDPKVLANTFTAFESYIKKDTVADIGFKLVGDFQLIDSSQVAGLADEEGNIVDYEITMTGAKEDYTIIFSEYKINLNMEMVLVDIDVENRLFTFEDLQDYSRRVILPLLDGYPVEGAVVGKGYKGVVVFEKGAYIASDEVETSDEEKGAVWGQEAKETKGAFEPDRFYFKPLGEIKGLTKEIKPRETKGGKAPAAKANLDF